MEAKKTKGRFIKKHDALFKVVTVTEFSLGSVAKSQPSVADNTRANVFHRRLHDDVSLNESIKENIDITQVFETGDKSPVLRPIDFTDDWHRIKNRYSKRRGKIDEEEELEMELEYLQGRLRPDGSRESTKRERNARKEREENEENERNDEREESEQYQEEMAQQSEAKVAGAKNGQSHIIIHHDSPVQENEVAALPIRPSRNPVSSLEDLESDMPSNLTNLANKFDQQNHKDARFEAASMDQNEELAADVSQDPKNFDDVSSERAPSRAEFRSLSSYIDPLAIRDLNESEQQLVEEAKAHGYEDGFKLGEEKATLQTKQMFSELTDTIEGLVSEIDALKKNVLLGAQENFYVLCNALAQAIFKREISLKPEILAGVIVRAVEEAVPDDEFKVILNSRTADALKKVLPESMRSKIRVDDSLENGKFRLDAKLTVVDGNISQLISDMIQQADLSLFETIEKAG